MARDVERGGTAISDLLDWTLYTIVATIVEIAMVTAVLAYYYDWGFVGITFVTLVAYIAFTVSITEWRTRYYRASVEADTKANERAVDSLLNYETVKYFGNEEHEARRYDENLQALENASVMSRKTLAVLNLGQTTIVALGVSAMMWRAAAGVVAGEMTVGDMRLFLLLACTPVAAFAQVTTTQPTPAPTILDRVQVTATRLAEPARDVPASVSIIERDDGRTDTLGAALSERLGTVPGLLARDRHNYAQDEQISIRGFGTRASFGIRGLRLYLDGVPATMPDGQGQVSHMEADRSGCVEGRAH